jgi:hypothetical protein
MLIDHPTTPQGPRRFGVGIDTARYGQSCRFLRDDLQPAAADTRDSGLTLVEPAKQEVAAAGAASQPQAQAAGQRVFVGFDAKCGKKGDIIDLWASVSGMSLRDAALDLIQTFGLESGNQAGTEKRQG